MSVTRMEAQPDLQELPPFLANSKNIVLPAERAQYSAIIDGILATGDLQTISAKQIRKGLAAQLDLDLSDKKVRNIYHFQYRCKAGR